VSCHWQDANGLFGLFGLSCVCFKIACQILNLNFQNQNWRLQNSLLSCSVVVDFFRSAVPPSDLLKSDFFSASLIDWAVLRAGGGFGSKGFEFSFYWAMKIALLEYREV